MNFTKGKIKDFYLLTTDVENIFINEYMPGAPGDYVKVYLYGLLYGQLGNEMTHEVLAKQLRLSDETVSKAWEYWANMGVVTKHKSKQSGKLSYDIEFVNLRALMYETDRPVKEDEGIGNEVLCREDLKDLVQDIERITGKVLSARDIQEIFSWVKELGAGKNIICRAFEYCTAKGKTNVNYVAKVVLQWTEMGIKDEEALNEYIEGREERQSIYKRILQSMGMNRGASEAEKRIMDTWLDDMKFNLERILEACDTTVSISNPNLKYVNKVLENWFSEAGKTGRDVNSKVTVTQAVLNKYYEYLRDKADKEAQERKNNIYLMIPRIKEIDEALNDLGLKASKKLLNGGSKNDIEEIKRLTGLLEEERAVLLTENNFNVDYTDIKYSCEKCSDTGIDENGQKCTCRKERIGEAELWQKTL